MKDTGPPAITADEKSTLLAFLNYLREAIAAKATGVGETEARTPGVSSGTNLIGLIKHLTFVERFYFLNEPITSMRRTFQPTRKETAEQLLAGYREAVREANEVIEACADLESRAPPARPHDALDPGPHDRGDGPARGPRRHPAGADRRRYRALRIRSSTLSSAGGGSGPVARKAASR